MFENLFVGIYFVIIFDVQGCVDVVEVEIDSSIVFLVFGFDVDFCEVFGVNLMVMVFNGILFYIYSIDGVVFQFDVFFLNIFSGLFIVMVVDVVGCEVIEVVDVLEVIFLFVLFVSIILVSCINDGGMVSIGLGFFSGFIFSFDGGLFGENLVFGVLFVGVYMVMVRNEVGCIENFEVEVEDLEDGLQLQEVLVQNIICGEDNGFLEWVLISGIFFFIY